MQALAWVQSCQRRQSPKPPACCVLHGRQHGHWGAPQVAIRVIGAVQQLATSSIVASRAVRVLLEDSSTSDLVLPHCCRVRCSNHSGARALGMFNLSSLLVCDRSVSV